MILAVIYFTSLYSPWPLIVFAVALLGVVVVSFW